MRIEPAPYEYSERYLLEVAYDGTNYSGWQLQSHCISVQEVVQKRLGILFNEPRIHLIGSSRTDAGVHALGFAASFLTPVRPVIDPERLRKAMNRQLPPDVWIRSVKVVDLDFHTRYDALGKAYVYIINQGERTPFNYRYSWDLRHKVDTAKMREAGQVLVGTHDFSSFVVERSMIEEAVRTIYRVEVIEFGQYIALLFVGNGFLYKMIRCLTGTLEAAGAGKISTAKVREILESCDRRNGYATAPPEGLFLLKVFYDQQTMDEFTLRQLPFLEMNYGKTD